MLSAALKLANNGMAVFPCRVRDKRPATANGCTDATRDPNQIKAWWQQDENFNIGIATGDKSGIFVVDVDNDEGFAALSKLGSIPDTVEAVTGKGEHFYFKMPPFDLRNSARKLGPGLDIRANGGYVLAPPSIHPSGKMYAWSVDSARTCAAAPQWLLDKLGDSSAPKPSQDWCAMLANIPEGQRDCTLTKITGYLLRHFIDPHLTRDLVRLINDMRCQPPLPPEDVERIIRSIATREVQRRSNVRR